LGRGRGFNGAYLRWPLQEISKLQSDIQSMTRAASNAQDMLRERDDAIAQWNDYSKKLVRNGPTINFFSLPSIFTFAPISQTVMFWVETQTDMTQQLERDKQMMESRLLRAAEEITELRHSAQNLQSANEMKAEIIGDLETRLGQAAIEATTFRVRKFWLQFLLYLEFSPTQSNASSRVFEYITRTVLRTWSSGCKKKLRGTNRQPHSALHFKSVSVSCKDR
jgi:hypothetical protein